MSSTMPPSSSSPLTSGSAIVREEPPTTVVWDPAMTAYDFGPTHPMAPARLELTAQLAQDLGVLYRPQLTVLAPEVAEDEELARVHDPDYIAAVRKVSADPSSPLPLLGLGTEDDPAFGGMHEAAARLAGASLLAADRILSGAALHAVNFGGGMHHAARDRASGFSIYNDAALAVTRLLDGGMERVVYIDVDAHHGDGTQGIFWDEPRVLTISLHESGQTLFPGTGFANETGGRNAPGSAVNIALPAGTSDAGWLRAFHSVVPAVVREFGPQAIVSQHGADSHRDDPLSNLQVTVDAQREVMSSVAGLAHRHCGGRWIATGGGGYNVYSVVPRSWTHLVAIASGRPLSVGTPIPDHWAERLRRDFGVLAPGTMGDDVDIWWRSWETGYDPSNPVDRAIMATRKEVFPLFGLDPWFD
ncbi:acetoin utilization protein AcuC [Arthrobacter sp. NPDC090010]|uniref:acetoin utilization protein AcuC n=1 Tax=Arthrobacter sp. NPDC090010 TaxID=3363942 RepID=UPI00381FF74A